MQVYYRLWSYQLIDISWYQPLSLANIILCITDDTEEQRNLQLYKESREV